MTMAAILDPYGRQIALDFTQEASRVTLVGDVPLGSGNSSYLRLGDWLGWISMAAFVLFLGFQIIVGRQAKRAAGP